MHIMAIQWYKVHSNDPVAVSWGKGVKKEECPATFSHYVVYSVNLQIIIHIILVLNR